MSKTEKIKLFLYINTLSYGGAERVIANLANQFDDAGYDVAVINSFPTDQEYTLGGNVIHYYLEPVGVRSNTIRRNIRRIRELRRILKKDKPDILISFMREANIRAVIACKGLKTKAVISVRNDPNKEYAGMFSRLLAKTLLTTADGCVFQTNDAKMWFPKRLQKKSAVIPNAVKQSFYETKWDPVPYLLVTCGRLTAQKNHKMQIDAVNALSKKYPHIQLQIYGEGELHDELRQYIDSIGCGDHVSLMGVTSDVEKALSCANVFILSSDYEGMPNALMEAMAVGVPCISTDCPCGGPRELIQDGKNGFLIPVRDTDTLIREIDHLLSNCEDIIRISLEARSMSNDYLPENVFVKWSEYIKPIL